MAGTSRGSASSPRAQRKWASQAPAPATSWNPAAPRPLRGVSSRCDARPIRSSRDAEEAARRYLVSSGFRSAQLTGAGPDGGVDVRAPGVVAQVKAQARPVSISVVQRTHGCAVVERASAAVFALDGFTASARAWADQHNVALFTFDLLGVPTPANVVARQLRR